MRQYTLIFMEQRLGMAHLSPVEGEQGVASFAAVDDEVALAYIAEHLLTCLKSCARAELSSMHIMTDPMANGGIRLVDDTHGNPRFQDTYVRYDTGTNAVTVDWDSTRTTLVADLPQLRTPGSRAGAG